MPTLGQADGLLKLLLSHPLIEYGCATADLIQIEIIDHHPDPGTHTALFDEGSEQFRILFHLQNSRYPATQQFRHGQGSNQPSFVVADNRTHGKIQTVGRRMTKVLGPATKNSIADMIMGADKPRQHNPASGIDDRARLSMANGDLIIGTDIGNTISINDQRCVTQNTTFRIEGDKGSVFDQGSHGARPEYVYL